MATAALICAILALLLALSCRSSLALLNERVARLESAGSRDSSSSDSEETAALNRKFIARLAAGDTLDPEQVSEGRLWSEVSGARAAELVDSGVRVLDVRTPQEIAGGMIPGAQQIPIEELQERYLELDRQGGPTLIYCAGGVRSAAACQFLTEQDYAGLYNLESGFGSWPGETVRPS